MVPVNVADVEFELKKSPSIDQEMIANDIDGMFNTFDNDAQGILNSLKKISCDLVEEKKLQEVVNTDFVVEDKVEVVEVTEQKVVEVIEEKVTEVKEEKVVEDEVQDEESEKASDESEDEIELEEKILQMKLR